MAKKPQLYKYQAIVKVYYHTYPAGPLYYNVFGRAYNKSAFHQEVFREFEQRKQNALITSDFYHYEIISESTKTYITPDGIQLNPKVDVSLGVTEQTAYACRYLLGYNTILLSSWQFTNSKVPAFNAL